MNNRTLWIALLAGLSLRGSGQGFVAYDHLPASTLKDKAGHEHGSGSLQRLSGRCAIALSRKLDERRRPTTWGLTLAAGHTTMHNDGEARELNPKRVLNASLAVTHQRPLAGRWRLMASLLAGACGYLLSAWCAFPFTLFRNVLPAMLCNAIIVLLPWPTTCNCAPSWRLGAAGAWPTCATSMPCTARSCRCARRRMRLWCKCPSSDRAGRYSPRSPSAPPARGAALNN